MGRRNRKSRPLASSSLAMTANHGASYDDITLAGWIPGIGSADADLLPDLETLTARSRDLARNNGLMSGGMQTMRDNIVGATLVLSCMPEYRLLGWTREQAREWGNEVEAKFRGWADTTDCDASNTLNLLGLTNLALSGAMLNGDAVALPVWINRAWSKWKTRILMVESDRLSTPPMLEVRNDIRAGIEFDYYGAPVAYHIRKRHPGDDIAFSAAALTQWDRIPAHTEWGRKRVIHLHDKERTGQSRGKPIVSAVMTSFKHLGQYSENELKASLANSPVAAFLESDLDPESAANLFGNDPRSTWGKSVRQARSIRKMDAGAIISLPVGARLNSFAPGRPNQAFEAFVLSVLRHIAAGMNIPYELLVKDFSKTNYSSARAALLEAWRYFLGRRRWLLDYWLRPIFELWLEEAVNAGQVSAPDFYEMKYAYSRCKFIFGGRGWVDPVKEAQASVLRMNAGISTMEKECAEQGDDFEEILDQREIEKQMMKERGLDSSATAATLSTGLAKKDTPVDSDEEEEKDE